MSEQEDMSHDEWVELLRTPGPQLDAVKTAEQAAREAEAEMVATSPDDRTRRHQAVTKSVRAKLALADKRAAAAEVPQVEEADESTEDHVKSQGFRWIDRDELSDDGEEAT